MSNTERIAVGLLGWQWAMDCQYGSRFERIIKDTRQSVLIERSSGRAIAFGGRHYDGPWPDFTTLDGVRLFEDALRDLGYGLQYRQALWVVRNRDTGLPVDLTNIDPHTSMQCGIFSTPEQRVAACIAVMDEAGL